MQNPRRQAAKGIAAAIAYYTDLDYDVFVPVSDTNRFDLIVYDGDSLLRVEVKTTARETGEVALRTMGGNRSWNGVIKRMSSSDCDRVFCVNLLTKTQREFKAADLEGRASVRVK